MDISLLIAVAGGVGLLLFLILVLRIPAFIALLISSITTGLWCGLSVNEVLQTVQNGMASTLGFVATVVGLGAIFGGILEASGGAKTISNALLQRFGTDRAPWAMLLTGFIVAIPVFFDVAFIILIPVVYGLQKQTGKSLLLYAIPLLAGLAITHTFIPPTPGPIAVADILGADLGWVIAVGFVVGIPTAIGAGLIFGRYISARIMVDAPEIKAAADKTSLPSMSLVSWIIATPIVLILINTLTGSGMVKIPDILLSMISLVGHPFSALIIANMLAWYLLGLKGKLSTKDLQKITTKSLEPTGIIILLTGAGGTFKQVLVDSGAGKMMAEGLTQLGLHVLFFAFLAAAIIRIVQGSATVAMITAAGLVSPLLVNDPGGIQLACITIAIASGATIFSHVNDSGFWLVKEYLGLNEKQTFKSLSVMTTLIAIIGLMGSSIIFLLCQK